jgi:hypothetical protein
VAEQGQGQTHTVRSGDTLIRIAQEYGFRAWEPIWNADENARLRDERDDPQVLVADDKVFIPPKTPKEVQVKTGQRHSFTVKTLKAHFRTVVRDEYGQPLLNKRFELEIKGEEIETKTLSGTTDADGELELDIHPLAVSGQLKVWLGKGEPEKVLTWELFLGNLEPIETVRGVKARLTNLGFLCGEINNEENEEYQDALTKFQIVYKVEVTGEADEATRRKLEQVHDKR